MLSISLFALPVSQARWRVRIVTNFASHKHCAITLDDNFLRLANGGTSLCRAAILIAGLIAHAVPIFKSAYSCAGEHCAVEQSRMHDPVM